MGNRTRRNLVITLSVAMTVAVVFNSGECGATSTISLQSIGNGTTTTTTTTITCVGGRGDECLIARQQDMDLEFQMPSEISRRVLASSKPVTPDRLDPHKLGLCGRPGQKPCAGQTNSGRYIPPHCGNVFERSCKKK